jgi:hypothetical protein
MHVDVQLSWGSAATSRRMMSQAEHNDLRLNDAFTCRSSIIIIYILSLSHLLPPMVCDSQLAISTNTPYSYKRAPLKHALHVKKHSHGARAVYGTANMAQEVTNWDAWPAATSRPRGFPAQNGQLDVDVRVILSRGLKLCHGPTKQ